MATNFTKAMVVAIAKAIRNCNVNANSKESFIAECVKVFKAANPLFNDKQFREIARGNAECNYLKKSQMMKELGKEYDCHPCEIHGKIHKSTVC